MRTKILGRSRKFFFRKKKFVSPLGRARVVHCDPRQGFWRMKMRHLVLYKLAGFARVTAALYSKKHGVYALYTFSKKREKMTKNAIFGVFCVLQFNSNKMQKNAKKNVKKKRGGTTRF